MTKFEELIDIISRKKNKGDVADPLCEDKEELEGLILFSANFYNVVQLRTYGI